MGEAEAVEKDGFDGGLPGRKQFFEARFEEGIGGVVRGTDEDDEATVERRDGLGDSAEDLLVQPHMSLRQIGRAHV